MEFSIDIHTTLTGEIIVEDFSKEYGQYLKEDTDIVISYDAFKYSETASLNAIIKVSTDKVKLVDVLLDKHEEDMYYTRYALDDGYYESGDNDDDR